MTPEQWRRALVALAAVLLLLVVGCTGPASPSAQQSVSAVPTTSPTAVPPTSAPFVAAEEDAATALAKLPVKGRAPMTGYDNRKPFGTPWADTDHNGCHQDDDVRARDLTEVVRDGHCKVTSGILADPYTGRTIAYRGGSTVQVDHVVALANAWQTGAQQLTSDQREALATDLHNLQATDGPTNQRKGAGDWATWKPPNRSYWCTYVSRQIAVKAAYGLWVTRPEHDAMVEVLDACPGQQLPTWTSELVVPPTAAPTTQAHPLPDAPSATPLPVPPPPTPQTTGAESRSARPGAFCKKADAGAIGYDSKGDPLICRDDGSGRHRWAHV
jgi:hypothetical protein